MHTIPELLEAAAIRLTGDAANYQCVTAAFGIHGRPLASSATVFQWRHAMTVPRDENAFPLAQILGVDLDYVRGCLIVARRRVKNYSRWKSQANREQYTGSIVSINTLLAKAVDSLQRKGHESLSMARDIRSWVSKRPQRRPPEDVDGGITVHSIVELIYALDGQFGLRNEVANARTLGVSYSTLPQWRRGRAIPREKYALSLALAIGIDFQYVLDCLAVARGQPIQGNGAHLAAAIRTVNSLLEKAATAYEERGLSLLKEADERRTRLGGM
jgi:transcriptional regulator with XRE-family HTH domain